MSRKAERRTITASVDPLLEDGESLLVTAAPWTARLGRTALLFTGRHVHLLALTDRRLIVFARRRRGPAAGGSMLAEPLEQLTLERARTRFTLFQLLVATGDQQRWVFEFRVRDHAVGHALVRVLHASQPA
jgi:hypothetical protein